MNEQLFMLLYRKQDMDIHVVAYFLLSSNYLVDICFTIKTDFSGVLIRFFKHYKGDYFMGLSEFFVFCAQKGDFSQEAPCLACISEPILFWQVGLFILTDFYLIINNLRLRPPLPQISIKLFFN